MIVTRSIIDAYHDDDIDIPLLANNGVSAILLKATQGSNYVDPTFKERYAAAVRNGLLVGSYHFADASDPAQQVAHWLSIAQPGTSDALSLDWEDNGANSMSYAQACLFVEEVFRRLGRYPMLYGSNFLSEKIPAGDSILFKCPLWLASYNKAPKIPAGWDKYTLWQYTDSAQFHGAGNPMDASQFDGTVLQLKAVWPFTEQ